MKSGGGRLIVAKSKPKDRFPEKLWRIVNECRTGAIGWSDGEDDVIFIKYGEFASQYLLSPVPAFKTQNVASFVRQLNLYGFHKIHCVTRKGGAPVHVPDMTHYFCNPNFRRDRQPVGMVRTYGAVDFDSGVRRGAGAAGSRDKRPAGCRTWKQMGTPVEHFVPDLISSLHQRDIDTHSVRFLSPKSPVSRKSRQQDPESGPNKVTKKQKRRDSAPENVIQVNQNKQLKFKSQRLTSRHSKLRDISNEGDGSAGGPEVRVTGIVSKTLPAAAAADWYTDMLSQMDKLHGTSFDAMAKSLGGEEPVMWYPKSWDRCLTLGQVMDTGTAPSALLSPLTIAGFDLIRDDSPLFHV